MISAGSVCKQCGQPIVGSYISALGALWHREHFVCAYCKRPFDQSRILLYEDVPYHDECYSQHIATRCAYCEKPLIGEYAIDIWGTKFCKEHQGQYQHCSFCGRLIPPHQQEPLGEHVRCTVCRDNAVEVVSEARPLYGQAIQWVNQQGLKYHNLQLELEICDRAKFVKLAQNRELAHSWGFTMGVTHSQNGRITHSEVKGIVVLQGLPALLFQGVVIHELGHVWCIVHGIHDLPSWVEEGFCTLLTYRYYREVDTQESRFHAQNLEDNKDPIYGEGFRRMRELSDKHGFAHLLEILRTKKRLPQ